MNVLSVVGNRPQFVKAAPTSVALRERRIDEIVLHTGQHYDRELSQVFFEELGLEEPHYALDLRTAEGVPGRVEVVGDVMADATRLFEPIARKRVDPVVDEPYDVLTIHREANTEPERLRRLVESLNATRRTFVFPVHPRTRKALDEH